MKWGTIGGRGKGNGEQRGGKVSIQPTRDLSGRESYHAKGGISKKVRRGPRNRGGIPKQEGGLQKDWGVLLQYHANLVYIVPIVYMSC